MLKNKYILDYSHRCVCVCVQMTSEEIGDDVRCIIHDGNHNLHKYIDRSSILNLLFLVI